MIAAKRLVRLVAIVGLVGCVVAFGDAAAAASFDCAGARTRAEKAICADPALAAADEAMGRAYRALANALPRKQRPGLVRDQREWLQSRDHNCGYNSSAADFKKCLISTTGFRTKFLSVAPVTTANGARIAPNLLHENQAGVYRITAIYPVAHGGDRAASDKFNNAARLLAIGRQDFGKLRVRNRLSVPNTFSESYRLQSLGHDLVSVLFSSNTYAGGAHGISARIALLFDMARGQVFGLDALLHDSARALPAISHLCSQKLRAQAAREGWANMLWIDDPKMQADPIKEVEQIKNWFVQPQGVDILFGDYTIGPYVIGMHECRLSYAELGPWIDNEGPLAALAK